MDRFDADLIIKSVAGFIAGIVSIVTGLFGVVFAVLLGLMAIDFITGCIAAVVSGEGLRSLKGVKGLFRKVYIMLLIGAVYMIEIAILKSSGVITDGVSGAFAVMELVSIVENGGRMGMRMPEFLTKTITTLKSKVGETTEPNKK